MKCFICDRGPTEGITIYRINPKGENGIWACSVHRPITAPHIDPEIKEIVRIIEEDQL